jgi:hypothetical protein
MDSSINQVALLLLAMSVYTILQALLTD